jgi:NAD(P) transhydrogenase subunit alpha
VTEALLVALYIFVLAVFVGFEVIAKVPTLLHTPLMSGSNAISGISVIGAIVIAGRLDAPYDAILGVAAVALATINVIGGFLVTDRMLRMFRRTPAANRDATRSASHR